MTAPSTYLRQLHETAARRRLEIAKLLRENPAITNKELASLLNVSRNTITLDRKAIVEQMTQSTQHETELLRAEMVGKLESLNEELEKHRRDGVLPVSVIHESLLVHRSIIELLGIRKAVVEQLEVKKPRPIIFETTIIQTRHGGQPKTFETVEGQLALGEGNHENH